MAQPLSPYTVFMGNRDVITHTDEVDSTIKKVNESLERLPLLITDFVTTQLVGVSKNALLEVVFLFRKAGWNVAYGFYPNAYINVGIFINS